MHPALRATAASILSLIAEPVGLAGGPLLTGLLSEAYGLPFALAVVPAFCLLAAVFFVLAARTYVADLKQAQGARPAPSGGLEPQPA